jgi:CheY-like chemotaxis protein
MPKKILVVDDSKTALMMEREILERRTTYQCVTASDGREAVEKAQQERPDLILMDVVMPNMNGFEACKMMRQQPTRARFPLCWSPRAAKSLTWRPGSRADATTTSPSPSTAPN